MTEEFKTIYDEALFFYVAITASIKSMRECSTEEQLIEAGLTKEELAITEETLIKVTEHFKREVDKLNNAA